MAGGSWVQDSFLGGQWSKFYQGRFKDPKYSTAMNLCLNAIPIEEGACTRRGGFNYIARTRGGVFAVTREFSFTNSLPYTCEFTPGHLRFAFGNQLVLEPTAQQVVSVSGATPSVITTATNHGWSTGDEVEFNLPVGATDVGMDILFNRQVSITVLSATTFSIADNVSQAPINGALLTLGPQGMLVSRVLDFVTPYTAADIASLNIRLVQGNNQGTEVAIVFCPDQQPQVLTATTNPNPAFNQFATFTFGPWTSIDGPYLDTVNDGGVITSATLTGIVTLTLAYQTWSSSATYGIGDTVVFSSVGYISLIDSNNNLEPDVNSQAWEVVNPGNSVGVNGFVATDVGRAMRLYSEPPQWNSATAYVVGNSVNFGGQFWTALLASTNNQPGSDVTHWYINTAAAAWTWGRIQTVVSATSVTLQLLGGALLYDGSTNPITIWQMGRYSNTTGWPSGGLYFEGRLWIWSTNFPNHFDGSGTDNLFQFTPSDADGTETDASGISETLNSRESNPVLWGIPAFGGFILGTQEGEWLVQATSAGEPLTSTSIQAHMNTAYGQANIEPKAAGLSFLMVKRFARKVLELILDVFTQKSVATDISLPARDLLKTGIIQIAYQKERTPIAWVATAGGQLAGTTYRRDSPYGTTPAAFNAWHQHQHGAGRQIVGLTASASPGGQIDSLTCVTWDGVSATGYSLEVLTDIFDVGSPLTNACFLDYSARPVVVAVTNGGTGVTLYGYEYLAGQTVQVWGGGLDLGDYTVSATGTIFVPFGADATYAGFFGPGTFGAYAPGLFTESLLAQLATEGSTFNNLGLFVNNGNPGAPGAPALNAIGEFFTGTYNYSTGGLGSGSADWKNNLFYVPGANGATKGITAYNLQAMAPVATASQTQIFGGTGADDGIGIGPVGQDGNIYYMCSSQNSGPLAKLSPNLTLLGKFGVGSGTTHSGAGGMAAPHSACCISAFHQYYVQSSIGTGNALFGGGGCEVAIADGTNMAFLAAWGVDQNLGGVTAGRQTNDGHGHYYAEAFGIFNSISTFALGPFLGAYGTTPFSFWRFTVNNNPPSAAVAGFTQVGTIAPGAIDPLWKWFSDSKGLVMDQADNNVIAYAAITNPTSWVNQGNAFLLNSVVMGSNGHAYQCTTVTGAAASDPTTDAGVHWTDLGVPAYVNAAYLYKINAATGAVMWTLALPNPITAGPMDDQNFVLSLVQNSRLALLVNDGSVGRVLWIDTNAGAILTNTSVTLDVSPQGQMMYGPLGLIGAVNYTNAGGATPIPLSPCTGSFTNHWGLFEATPALGTPLFGPFVVGYTYTTKGQILRVVDPEASGARNGPAMGKTRKIAQLAWLLTDTSGVSFGVDFDLMRPAELRWNGTKGDPQAALPMPPNITYDNISWASVDSDWNFDSMPCWQVTRPYPCTVVAVEGFQETSDR